MVLKKPKDKSDLVQVFTKLGEANWDVELRKILTDYDVPLPEPCTTKEIKQCEERLGVALPQSFKLFLEVFGSVDFGGIAFFLPEYIDTADYIWFSDFLSKTEQVQLPHLLQIAESGCNDVYVLDLASGRCGLCSHDPAGVSWRLPSFEALVEVAVIELSCGYYGWPDDEISTMAEALKDDLFPYI